MISTVQQRGKVPFPLYTGERVYMREFTKASGLPADLSRWQDTVDAMLDGIGTTESIFLMVDQAPVKASTTHRRPGMHVDGCWHPEIGGHGGHGMTAHHKGRWLEGAPSSESILLATNVLGCAAFVGSAHGAPADGGDCSHIDASGLIKVEMEPGRVWAGDTMTMLHEALPVKRDAFRTVVRLNVRGWSI